MTPSGLTVLLASVSVLAAVGRGPTGQAEPATTGLDHIPIAVADLESAAEQYRSLGFVLKPGRPHDNGIRNVHAKFADGTELELITAPAARDDLTATYRQHLLAGDGPAFLAFHAPGLDEARRRQAPGYIFFGGLNRSLTDKPEHFAHPNGGEALIGVWLAADDLSRERKLLEAMGAAMERREALVPTPQTTDVARFLRHEVVLLPGRFQLVPGRRIVGATVAVSSAEAARGMLEQKGIKVQDGSVHHSRSIFIAPAWAHGLWLELRQRR